MTELVCKPEKAPVVKGRGLYEVYMNRKPLGLHIRARNAGEADEMLRVVFRHELTDKNLDFRIEDFKEGNDGKEESGISLHQREVEERGDAQGRKCLHEEGVRTDTGRAQLS